MYQLNQQNSKAIMIKSNYGSIKQNFFSSSQLEGDFGKKFKVKEIEKLDAINRKLITRDQDIINEYNNPSRLKIIITNRPKTKDKHNSDMHAAYRNLEASSSYFQNTNIPSNTLNFNFDFDSNKKELLEKNSLTHVSFKNYPLIFANQTDRINYNYKNIKPPEFPQTSEIEQKIMKNKNQAIIKINEYSRFNKSRMLKVILNSKNPKIYYNSNLGIIPQNNKTTWLKKKNNGRKIQSIIDHNYSLAITKNLKIKNKNSNSVDSHQAEKSVNIKSCTNGKPINSEKNASPKFNISSIQSFFESKKTIPNKIFDRMLLASNKRKSNIV